MRFIVDECTGPKVAQWLREQGHDVLSVHDDARSSSDTDVLNIACADQRILITNDKDFGELIFRERSKHFGIVLLRLQDERSHAKIDALSRLLQDHADDLANHFVVVTEKLIRISKIVDP